MDFSIVTENIDLYVEGLWMTVQLVVISLAIGIVGAIPLAVLRTTKSKLINAPIRAYVYFFRGTPLLVQMFLIYYGSGQFEFFTKSFLWTFLKEPYICALLAFGLNTCAYTTEIIRGAIITTSHGEVEAAKSVGMSKILMMRRIILPSAFRRALQSYSNEVIFMVHASSLASIITLIDLTGAARMVNSKYYSPYEAFLTVAGFYMVITFTLIWLFKKLEYKWYAHLRPQDNTIAS